MSKIKQIIGIILSESSGLDAKLKLTRIGLKAGINLSNYTEGSPEDPEKIEKLLKSAKEVLGKEIKL